MDDAEGADCADDMGALLSTHLDVSRETLSALEIYDKQLVKWQRSINLIAPSTVADRHRRHFLDSLQLLPLIRAHCGSGDLVTVDIGAGAGFPGLVLAMAGLGPVHLIESNGKKAGFMRTVSRETGCGVTVHQQRVEAMSGFAADLVVSRACATVGQLLVWGSAFTTARTQFWLLKGEKAQQELTDAQAHWTMHIEQFDSISDPRGVILKLSDIRRR